MSSSAYRLWFNRIKKCLPKYAVHILCIAKVWLPPLLLSLMHSKNNILLKNNYINISKNMFVFHEYQTITQFLQLLCCFYLKENIKTYLEGRVPIQFWEGKKMGFFLEKKYICLHVAWCRVKDPDSPDSGLIRIKDPGLDPVFFCNSDPVNYIADTKY